MDPSRKTQALRRCEGGQSQVFAVNLPDPLENNLAPRGHVPPEAPDNQADSSRIDIGDNPARTTCQDSSTGPQWSWPLPLVALGVLLVEWSISNRGVYV